MKEPGNQVEAGGGPGEKQGAEAAGRAAGAQAGGSAVALSNQAGRSRMAAGSLLHSPGYLGWTGGSLGLEEEEK